MDEKKFISSWVQNLNVEKISCFPRDFLMETEFTTVTLPQERLLLGKDFFGEYELINTEGIEFLKVDSYEKAKYFIYSNRNKPKQLAVPINHMVIIEMIAKYEKYIDSILKRIDTDYRKKFNNAKNSILVINQIFNHLNLVRL